MTTANAEEVLLVVFFEGTANTIRPVTTQIGEFAAACVAEDLSGVAANDVEAQVSHAGLPGPFKLAFDGCGVTNGVTGALFAAGLDGQCLTVAAWVRRLSGAVAIATAMPAASPQPQRRPVRVVAVGLSRGGIACMKLAKVLASATPGPGGSLPLASSCTVSMLLFDPVPGNAVSSGFPFTALGSNDLRLCGNLRHTLALYPHQPLPDAAMHAPVLCRYQRGGPGGCDVEEDVTLGCHQVLHSCASVGSRFVPCQGVSRNAPVYPCKVAGTWRTTCAPGESAEAMPCWESCGLCCALPTFSLFLHLRCPVAGRALPNLGGAPK